MRKKKQIPDQDGTQKPIPSPAHPVKRREPLPWQQPKPFEEEPDVKERVRAIMESPNFREADRDSDFLHRDEARGVRLHVDYLKAELLLHEHGVQHTIVVFGSTRVCEPDEARRRVAELLDALERRPGDKALRQRLAKAERILEKSRYYEIAREFGRIAGMSGRGPEDSRVTLMTGGGPGIMEAANRGAYDAGAKSIGLNITLPHEQYPNPYVTPELCFQFHYFALRKLHFLRRACALVAFPGGYGTLDELFETLTLIQSRKIPPVPVILVGEAYWTKLVDIDFLVEEGTIDEEDRELFWYAENAREIWKGILQWHKENDTPLF
jgi:uncharacterized protein (TIGR00730 family)